MEKDLQGKIDRANEELKVLKEERLALNNYLKEKKEAGMDARGWEEVFLPIISQERIQQGPLEESQARLRISQLNDEIADLEEKKQAWIIQLLKDK